MASKYVIVDHLKGDENSVGICGTADTFEEAVEMADFAITCHLFEGIFENDLDTVEFEPIRYNDEVRGLHISDGYGELGATVAIFGDGFNYCYV